MTKTKTAVTPIYERHTVFCLDTGEERSFTADIRGLQSFIGMFTSDRGDVLVSAVIRSTMAESKSSGSPTADGRFQVGATCNRAAGGALAGDLVALDFTAKNVGSESAAVLLAIHPT